VLFWWCRKGKGEAALVWRGGAGLEVERARGSRGGVARGSRLGGLIEGGRKVGRKRRKEKRKRKEKKEEKKTRNRKRKRNRKMGKKIGKSFRKIRRISREIRGKVFVGFSGFSGVSVIFGTVVMARRTGRRDHGVRGTPVVEADRGAEAARVGDGPGAGGAGGIRGTRNEGKESAGVSKGGK
jgi:hypothetical protein